jgi:LysR family glycine cleavage system transcriptional activator
MNKLPPLNALRCFEVSGRLKSIRRAAAELNVTPAAVSRQVRALESFLRWPLFTRGHRVIALTPFGEQYLSDISRHFAGIRDATERIRGTAQRHTLNIRAFTAFAIRWLIPRLSSFHALHPQIAVRLTTSADWTELDQGDIDGAIRFGNGRWPDLIADQLVPNVLVPVCSPQLRIRGPADPQIVKRHVLLHSLARPDDWATWLKAAGLTGIDTYSGQKYENSALAYEAAIAGHGIALGQKVLVEDDLTKKRLCAPFDLEIDMGGYTFYFVTPKKSAQHKELRLFREWITSQH